MPAPATNAEFLDLVRKSGVLDDKRLDAHLERLRASGTLPVEPSKLAGVLVRDGYLTHFQAEQFLQGKWRRFTIGKYKVLERLGQGGMGSVYLCEHTLMRRRVALKVLPTHKADDPAALERFYREARAVAALDHPNIVRAYDIDTADNFHFLVMEHVDGSSLQDMVKKTGPMEVLRACHYIRQAALGLQHAHETATLVHRDIKPGNILVDRNGIVKVLDMGLARFFNDEDDVLTKKYDENVLGTADYLAPEQALDSHAVDIRADIYSLGGTFYYCLTGHTPFAEGTVAQKLIWHQTRQPKPITTFRSDVPEALIAILNKMMAKDPDQRFPTPLAVAEALEPWTTTPIPPPPEAEMPQLSLAAMGSTAVLSSASETATVPASGSNSASGSGARKNWQVAVTTVSRPATPQPQPPQPVPAQPAAQPQNPPSGKPAAQPLPPPKPTPVPPSRPLPVPAAPVASPPTPASARAATPAPALQPVPAAPLPVPPPLSATPPRARSSSSSSGRSNGTNLLQASPVPKPAPSPQPIDPFEPLGDEDADVSWKQVAGPDTDDDAHDADTLRHTSRRRSLRPTGIEHEKEAARVRRRLWGIIIGVGMVFLITTSLIVWAMLPPSRPTGSTQPSRTEAERTPQTLTVGTNEPFKTLGAALARVQPGDRIVVRGELREQLFCNNAQQGARWRNVSIEGEGGKVVWKVPERLERKVALISLIGTDGLTIKGFVLDGANQVENLVLLTTTCPGTTIQDVQLQNYLKRGIVVINCEGKQNQPVLITGVRCPDAKLPPITFDANERMQPKENNHVVVQNCTFTGPSAFVQITAESCLGEGIKIEAPKRVQK